MIDDMITRSKRSIDRLGAIAVAAAVIVAGAAAATTPIYGQEAMPDRDDGRFELHRVDGGYLRLDLRTGEVALCAQRATGWTCTMAPEERTAMGDEIARLQRENAGLKSALLKRGLPLPDGMAESSTRPPAGSVAPDPPKAIEPSLRLPESADLDRAIALMDKLWRRLVEMVASFQRDIQKKS